MTAVHEGSATVEAAAANAQRHWRASRRLTAALLLLWCVVSFAGVWFARELSFRLLGWPFSFWLAAQGALLAYLVIVWYYARTMRRIDLACGLSEEDG